MQNLQLFNNILTMSSLEIAEYTNKEHNHVMRDIRNMLAKLGKSDLGLSSYKSKQNKDLPMYELDEELTLTLVTKYDDVARNKIINEWLRLKQNHRPIKEYTELELARNFVRVLEEREELKQQVQLLEPFKEKVENSKVIFPKKQSIYNQERGFKKDVKNVYPFLSNAHISLILDYYTTTKYKDTDHYIKSELDCVSTFFTEADMKVSTTKDTVIVKHPCLLTNTMRIRKDKAIEYLDYTEEEFE